MKNWGLFESIMTAAIFIGSNHNNMVDLNKLDPAITSPLPLVSRLMSIKLREDHLLINFAGVGLEGIHQWHVDNGEVNNLIFKGHMIVIIDKICLCFG